MGIKIVIGTSQILILGGYVKTIESLYARLIIWVNTVLNHIDTRVILSRVREFLNGIYNRKVLKIRISSNIFT